MVTERFLNLSIRYLGFIPTDTHVEKAVRQQKAVAELFPNCSASKSFVALAEKISHLSTSSKPKGNLNLFWQSLMQKPIDQQPEGIFPQS
jgi:flagellar biosynthesis protein FlhG